MSSIICYWKWTKIAKLLDDYKDQLKKKISGQQKKLMKRISISCLTFLTLTWRKHWEGGRKSEDILSEDQNESFGDSSHIKDSRTDEEFNIKEKQVRRSDRKAMQVLSSVVKTVKKDGKQVDFKDLFSVLKPSGEEDKGTETPSVRARVLGQHA